MQTQFTPQERAELLDKLLVLLASDPPPNRPTRPWYLTELDEKYQVDHFVLVQMIRDEGSMFEIIKQSDAIHGKIQGEVIATTQAKAKYKSGFSFMKLFEIENLDKEEKELKKKIASDRSQIKDLRKRIEFMNQDELIELEKRKLSLLEESEKGRGKFERKYGKINLILVGITVVATCFAAWGAVKEKIYDKEKLQWNQDKKAMQSQIDVVTKQLNAIPDSIKEEYIK